MKLSRFVHATGRPRQPNKTMGPAEAAPRRIHGGTGAVAVPRAGRLGDRRQHRQSDFQEGRASRRVRAAQVRGDDRLARPRYLQRGENRRPRSRQVSAFFFQFIFHACLVIF